MSSDSDPRKDEYIRIEINRRRLKAVLIVVLGLVAAELTSETLTMTTWYPSPSGTYKTLRSTMNAYFAYSGISSVGIGTTAPANKLSVNGNADFSGNVGIGTTSPQAKLHVAGTPGVDGIKFPDGTLQKTAATAASSTFAGYCVVSDSPSNCCWGSTGYIPAIAPASGGGYPTGTCSCSVGTLMVLSSSGNRDCFSLAPCSSSVYVCRL